MMQAKRQSPAFLRNRDPVLGVLRHRWGGAERRVLELASGPGQHAVYFAQELPLLTVQPTEQDPSLIASIDGWRRQADEERVLPGLLLDVTRDSGAVASRPTFDGALAINFFHMVPMDVVKAALEAAASRLRSGGELIVYDCFTYAGQHVSESNRRFHKRLQTLGGAVHSLEQVSELAGAAGFGDPEIYWLIANNQCVVWTLRN